MTKLRLGVIGAGSWAVAAHLPALQRRASEVEFVGICRRDDTTLARLRERFGFTTASTDYREILAAGIDIAVVASPAAFHFEHAKAALEAGAHVLCEKPMTIDPDQAWQLVDTASRQDRQLLIAFGWNYQPMVRQAKSLMDTYGIGRLEHMSVVMSSPARELLSNAGAYPDAAADTVPEPQTWTDPALSGGGYGQAQLSHALGLALHLIPERVSGAYALMSATGTAPVDTHDAICLRFDGGGIGVLSGAAAHTGAAGNKHALEVRAVGSDGQLLVDLQREAVWLFRRDGADLSLALPGGAGSYDGLVPADALVDVALGVTGRNHAPGELGARTVEALALAYRSARESGYVARVHDDARERSQMIRASLG